MEPHMSVLLYSKYSAHSKQLMNMMQSSNVDFTREFRMQTLCIDNEEMRQRILSNVNVEVSTVPCLLIIYPDGGIEKYDGEHVFNWTEEIIKQNSPPQPPPVIEPVTTKKSPQIRPKKHKYRKPVKQFPKETVTDIGDLVSESDEEGEVKEKEDNLTDRYRTQKPRKSILQDAGNHIESEEFFDDPVTDMRRPKQSAVRTGIKKKEDLMSIAKEMEKSREENPDRKFPPGIQQKS